MLQPKFVIPTDVGYIQENAQGGADAMDVSGAPAGPKK